MKSHGWTEVIVFIFSFLFVAFVASCVHNDDDKYWKEITNQMKDK